MNSPPPLNVIGVSGPGTASAGPDHSWFTWTTPALRPRVQWPDDARVAVAVVVDLGAVEWEPAGTSPAVPPVGGRGVAPAPDFPRMSHREFGHRVGVFRLLEMLKSLAITPAAVVDVLTVEQYPALLPHLRSDVGEYLCGGLSASRPVTASMSEDEERHYIGMSLDRLEAGLGIRAVGWRGPEHSESSRTPRLLAESGVQYLTDWCNDEQPYPMSGADGLWSFPLSWELADVNAVFLRDVSVADYARSITDAAAQLSGDGSETGRVLGLHLHPWLTGQAFRVEALEEALAEVRDRWRVWFATPSEIVDWVRGRD